MELQDSLLRETKTDSISTCHVPEGCVGASTPSPVNPEMVSNKEKIHHVAQLSAAVSSRDSWQTPPTTTATAVAPVRRFLGWIQVRTLIGKNFLNKRRTPFGTFFEIFSPFLFMLVLVAAYTLSEITTQEAQQYVTQNVSLPGPWIDLASGAINVSTDGGLLSTRRDLRTFTSLSSPIASLASQGSILLQELGLLREDTGRRLQTNGNNETDAATNDDASVFDVLDGASKQLQTLLASPIPVPSLDQYVTASRGLSALLSDDELPIILQDSSYGRSWGNLLTLGALHLSPDSDVVREFQEYLQETYPDVADYLPIQVHQSEESALMYVNSNLNNRTWAVIDLSGYVNDEDVSYKIRMNYTTLPNTNMIVNYISIGLDRKYERYYLSGYLTLQRTLNEFAMARLGCNSSAVVSNMWSMPMPTAAYNQNAFFQAVGFLLGLTIAMAYMYPTSRTIKSMVEEKELRLKETLSILGVRPWAHFWSWLLTNLFVFTLIAVLVTLALTSQVLKHSNAFYIFLYIGLFSTATVGFCFVVAACCSKAKFAAIVGPMALFATLLPRYIFFGSNRYEAIPAKLWASLLPCTAFAFGADIIADYEYAEVGVQSWNISEGQYSFNTVIGFLFFDTLLYIFLGWYLELVIPRQYGVARPWYFPVSPSYWKSFVITPQSKPAVSIIGSDAQKEEPENYESVTDPSWVPRVVIDDLVKRYKKKPDVPPAVDHLNLTLYESQITCLLGHNGAGKTSTISVLTGLYPPTSGDCYIYGNSITNAINEARQSMGICPQHNVLFDGLTVVEHLAFFQRIKGLKPTQPDLRHSAEEIGLGDYLRTTSVALSGGNKRKLSLAISLCGDPRFLLLDEPTSGMDVASRRNCWELLRRKRAGRVTLLTTHFLDEASLLADRIAIMKEGRLQCCGSELFLKNRFGLGYNLTVVLADPVAPVPSRSSIDVDEVESMESGSIVSSTQTISASAAAVRITEFLNSYIPNTTLIRTSARELTFRFPPGSEAKFPDAFDAMEEERAHLCIGAYGISDTTLEEIFLQLAETEACDSVDTPPKETVIDSLPDGMRMSGKARAEDTTEQHSDVVSDPSVVDFSRHDLRHLHPLRQIALLYRKRFVVQRRDLKGFLFQIVLPTLLCALVLLVLTIDVPLAGPPIEMSMSLFQSGIDGKGTRTDVVVGGGASLNASADSRRLSVIDDEFNELGSTLNIAYPNAEFVNLGNAVSSRDVSQHLLDSYNKHDHNARFGSFVLHDTVNLTVEMNWEDMMSTLQPLANGIGSSDGVLGVRSWVGSGERLIEWNVTAPDLERFLIQWGDSITPLPLNPSSFLNTTQNAVQSIIDSAKDVNGTIVVGDLLDAFNTFIGGIRELNQGSTNATFANLSTSFIDDLLLIVINGTLSSQDTAEAIQTRGEVFDRTVIVAGMLEIVDALLEPWGGLRNSSETVVDVIVQGIDAMAVAANRNLSAAPNELLALPTIVLHEFAKELIQRSGANETIAAKDFIGALFDFFPFADVYVKVESMSVSLSSGQVILEGLRIEIMSVAILDDPKIQLNMNTLLGFMEGLLPSGKSNYVMSINPDVSILHNSSSPHAVGAFNQAYMEYLFMQCTGSPSTARLASVNHPLPLTDQQTIDIKTILSILSSLFLLIPYCYIPGAFIVFLVKERVSKSKHLQLVSGVDLTSYWISSYLWDLSLFFILTLMIMAVFLMYGRESAVVFVGDSESFIATMLLTFGYGLSVLPFSYLLSRPFNNHSSAQIAVMGITFVCGFVAVNAYFILSSIDSTKDLAEALRPFFRWWPPYNVGEGFIGLARAYWEREVLGSDNYPLDWDVTGRSLAIIYGLALPYFLLLLFLEYSDDGGAGAIIGRVLRTVRSSFTNYLLRWYGVRKSPDGMSFLLNDGLDEGRQEDDDVAAEQAFVAQNALHLKDTASVLLVNMWKVFPPSVGFFGKGCGWIRRMFNIVCCCGCFRKQPDTIPDEEDNDKSRLPKRAVRGVSTAIMEGETYGLLGGK